MDGGTDPGRRLKEEGAGGGGRGLWPINHCTIPASPNQYNK